MEGGGELEPGEGAALAFLQGLDPADAARCFLYTRSRVSPAVVDAVRPSAGARRGVGWACGRAGGVAAGSLGVVPCARRATA